MFTRSLLLFLLLASIAASSITAQQNNSENVRRIPPAGVEIPAADRAELEAGVAQLGKEIEALHIELKNNPALLNLLPDVQIFYNAVRYALTYGEFFKPEEVKAAAWQLKQGMERAYDLRSGRALDSFANVSIVRQGQRIVAFQAQAWQEDAAKPIATAFGHFKLRQVADRD